MHRDNWQAGRVPTAKQRRERQIRKVVSQKEGRHQYDARIKSSLVHLHRQLDTKGFVFPRRKALQPRAVAPTAGYRFTTNAHQDASESRIRGLNRPARDAIESDCGGILVDTTRKDHHRSARRHVPLGKTLPQKRERRSATSRNRSRMKGESFVVTYAPARSTTSKSKKYNNIERVTV
jgi:hypothetical protein